MISRSVFARTCRWLHLPTGVLIALLQRTPVLKIASSVGEYVLASPAGSLLKAAVATAASLGAVHSLAGATTLSSTTQSPASATVNTPVSVAFSVLGTTSEPESWTVGGELAPGLALYSTPTGGTGSGTGTINAATLYLRGTPTTAGSYAMTLRANDMGGFMSPVFNFTVNVTAGGGGGTAPSISVHPSSVTVAPGGAASLSVTASGSDLTYQWKKDGVNVAGATSATLGLAGVNASQAGNYTVTISNSAGSAESRFARVVVGALQPGKISNLSVRSVAGSGGSPLIVGMVLTGGSKQILVRAVGPGLTPFGVSGVLGDPKLDVYDGGTVVLSNDNWGATGAGDMSAVFASVGAFALSDATSKDSAVVTSMAASRTVHVNAATGTGGVVLVESYDTEAGNAARFANVSARNRVGTGGEILIAGFVIDGNMPRRVLIRGIGPRLADFGVTGALADPQLEIHTRINDQDVLVATNDDWSTEANSADMNVIAGGLQLTAGSKDAAVLLVLPAGSYTAHVRGAGNTTGEGLVEVYDGGTP